jgi:alanine racemase
VPIGYADGYRRALTGRGWMGIQGHRAPVLGRVAMDQVVVDVPLEVEAKLGDVVHVLGGDPSDGAPTIAQMAALFDTNTYEVLVGIRQRIPRIYLRCGEAIAIDGANQHD